MRVIAFTSGLITLVLVSPATAQPCDALSPSPGTTFSGAVSSIIDERRLCVGAAKGGIPVILSDFIDVAVRGLGNRANQKILARIAKGKHVTCAAGETKRLGTVAVSRLRGQSLGDLLRAASATRSETCYLPEISTD